MFWNKLFHRKKENMVLYSIAKEDGSLERGEAPEEPLSWKEWLPAVISAVAIVFCIVLFWAVRTFPLRITATTSAETASITDDLQVSVKANQKIKSIGYYFNPGPDVGISDYKQAVLDGEKREKNFVIPMAEVPNGVSGLSLYVKTAFGDETVTVSVVGNIGFITAPDSGSFVELDDYSNLVSNELIVYFVPEATEEEINALIAKYNGTIVGRNNLVGEYTIRFTGKGESFINEMQQKLEADPLVDEVFFNVAHEYEQMAVPNDGGYDSWDVSTPAGNNWGLEAIDAPGAWDYADRLNTVKVGVLDSFLEYSHEDLQVDPSHTRIMATNDFTSMEELNAFYEQTAPKHTHSGNDCVYCSMRDHGTHCSGIIGAKNNNSKGVSGVAWNSDLYFASFWYIKKAGGTDKVNSSAPTNSLSFNLGYLVASGCRVVNISLGSTNPTKETTYEKSEQKQFNKFVERLEESGYDFLFCKAAGNDSSDASEYMLNRIMTSGEASRRHTIIVGAVEQTKFKKATKEEDRIYNLAKYSNYGDLLDITAPGSSIYSTVQGNTYRYMSGTSMATPVVTGICTLVYGTDDRMTYDKVKEIICNSAVNYSAKNGTTYNMVNARRAMELAYDASLSKTVNFPDLGYVTGNVQDADTMKLINTADVHIINEATGAEYDTNTLNGMYELGLPRGVYTMEFSAKKYMPDVVYHVDVNAEVVKYNALLNLVPAGDAKGIGKGTVIDGTTGQGIADANISFMKGVGNTDGTVEGTATTDKKGNYSIELAPGNYTMVVNAAGYERGVATVVIVSGKTKDNQDCTLTPALESQEIRIILTWGNKPEDLDAHLEGPAAAGGKFHIYYKNREYSAGNEVYENLDVDARKGYGPETITIYRDVAGTYAFSVYDYSDRKSAMSNVLSMSGAKVTVYIGESGAPYVFDVPTMAGTKWNVFTMTNRQITPVNTMEYYDPGIFYEEDSMENRE